MCSLLLFCLSLLQPSVLAPGCSMPLCMCLGLPSVYKGDMVDTQGSDWSHSGKAWWPLSSYLSRWVWRSIGSSSDLICMSLVLSKWAFLSVGVRCAAFFLQTDKIDSSLHCRLVLHSCVATSFGRVDQSLFLLTGELQ